MSTLQDMGSLLLVRGADELDHAGGTLYVHLHRVAKRLTTLGASDTLVVAGLAHAAYGTDGFPTHLFDWQTERPVLESIIGSEAELIVYRALDMVGEKTGKPPVEILEQAVKSVTPVLEVRSRRVGGANYQVPVEVPQRRARTLAIRYLVTYSRERREKSMQEKLAGEILDALEQQGGAFKRKDDLYRMAQANKAFAHYRW